MVATASRFLDELADCWRFLRRPTLRGRSPGRRPSSGLIRDWWPGIRPARLLAWAAVLWAINVFALGPIAVAAADAVGAKHHLDTTNLPWLSAILWAPFIEEMLFRYGLRRPAQAAWIIPLLVGVVVWWGAKNWTIALSIIVLVLASWPLRKGRPKRWRMGWRREYAKHYPWIFHLASLTFAGLHLTNFGLHASQWWLLPLLVLPQWVTGLVLGWMRTRRGIGAAMALHAVFNAGPVLMIMLAGE